jgi:hypothetical protein
LPSCRTDGRINQQARKPSSPNFAPNRDFAEAKRDGNNIKVMIQDGKIVSER